MTRLRACILASAVSIALSSMAPGPTAKAQPGAGTGQTPPEQPGARIGGPAGRRAPVDTLGDGPWDLDTETGKVHVSVVAKGIDHPWSVVFLPDGNMLLTERPGRLRIVRDGVLDPQSIGGLPAIISASIGGLQGLALHPDFEQNRLIYFAYTKPKPEDEALTSLAVARARWDGGYSLSDVEDIFVAQDWYSAEMAANNDRCCGQGPASGSYGARIAFDAENRIYITSGDRNWGENAQDPRSHLGKIIRLNDDGSVPADNPFVGRKYHLPELYTIGHRNPTGLRFDDSGRLWSTEFGTRGGDELNLIEAGKNYGWILVTQGEHYNGDERVLGTSEVEGYVDPVFAWGPSGNPGNLIVYSGDDFPEWQGDLLVTAMSRPGALERITLDDDGNVAHRERMLTELDQRMRDVAQGPDGRIYVLTDETVGAMLLVEPGE